jgi:hypothetical protein
LETLLKETFSKKASGEKQENPKVHLVRYADDFIITGNTKELLENEVRPLVEQLLRDRGLQLSPEKTCITSIDQGFDFLGQNVRKYGGKLLTKPSKKNLHSFLEKVRTVIRRNRPAKQENLIRVLNPIIRGWANITAILWRPRPLGKQRWSSGIVSGDGPSVGTPTGRQTGSQNDTGTDWDEFGARLRPKPAQGGRTVNR